MPESILKLALTRKRLSVPLTAILRDLSIEGITHSSFSILLKQYELALTETRIRESIFPNWLDQTPYASHVQVQPAHYLYDGYFPLGCWIPLK